MITQRTKDRLYRQATLRSFAKWWDQPEPEPKPLAPLLASHAPLRRERTRQRFPMGICS